VIDFDAFVLTPAGNVFQIAVLYMPLMSQPGVAAFSVFGVWSSSALQVEMQDGTIFSDQQTKLDVRLGDFAAYPTEGDLVTINEPTHPAFGRQYWIGTMHQDGQGGGELLLRYKEPPS
jgi:hypothetical protein